MCIYLRVSIMYVESKLLCLNRISPPAWGHAGRNIERSHTKRSSFSRPRILKTSAYAAGWTRLVNFIRPAYSTHCTAQLFGPHPLPSGTAEHERRGSTNHYYHATCTHCVCSPEQFVTNTRGSC